MFLAEDDTCSMHNKWETFLSVKGLAAEFDTGRKAQKQGC